MHVALLHVVVKGGGLLQEACPIFGTAFQMPCGSRLKDMGESEDSCWTLFSSYKGGWVVAAAGGWAVAAQAQPDICEGSVKLVAECGPEAEGTGGCMHLQWSGVCLCMFVLRACCSSASDEFGQMDD